MVLTPSRMFPQPRHTSLVALLAAVTAACSSAGPGQSRVAQVTAAPAPFVLQFVGTYADPSAPSGAVAEVDLGRDGSYRATFNGNSATETGTFHAESGSLPVTLSFEGTGAPWTGTIQAYDGVIHAAYGATTSTLRASAAVGPNEALCDATGGAWADDEADPTTGLYCVCPAPQEYIPSAGGCVE